MSDKVATDKVNVKTVTLTDDGVPLPRPFLGRALIKALANDSQEYLEKKLESKIDKDLLQRAKASGIALSFKNTYEDESGQKVLGDDRADYQVPLHKGVILEMAPDFCGDSFKTKAGSDVGYTPKVGDVVWFVPNETFAIDPARVYHLINDCDIVAYEEGESND